MKSRYIPDRGHLVWLDFVPQAGHEQSGRRPAVVLSPITYNRVGLSICCPVTSRSKGYPFEVPLPSSLRIGGVVLADQIKNVDWKARNIEFAGRISSSLLNSILERVFALIDPNRT